MARGLAKDAPGSGFSGRRSRTTSAGRAATAEQRAYISGGGNADDVRQNFLLLINNAGKTPGEITAMEFGFCDAADMPPEPIYTTFPSVAWIAPDTHHLQFTTIEIQSMRPGVSIPPGDINVYGRIRYRDVFRRPYHFCFCVTVRPDGRTFVTPNPPRAYIGWQ